MPWIVQPPDPEHPDVTVKNWEPDEGEPEIPPREPDTDGMVYIDDASGLKVWECQYCPEIGNFGYEKDTAAVLAHVLWHKKPWWYRWFVQRPTT